MTTAIAHERQASWLELFFDLVLVAAVAALAGQLHEDHSLTALAVFAGLFVPVWWTWWGFTWYSNSFNADDAITRVALLVAMAGVGALAAGVPGAAHGASNVFVLAFGGLFALLSALYARAWLQVPAFRRLSTRYVVGDSLGAAIWLGSLLVDEGSRPLLWGAAMVVLMGAPVLAAASIDVLSYDARHIAERYGLFTLIVLGESVVATVTRLRTGSSTTAVLVALLGLVLAAAIWWLYFDRWRSMPAGGLRSGYAWAQGHLLIFAGIAATAVGVDFAIEAAADGRPLVLADRLPLGAGLAAYLSAMALVRSATRRPDWIAALRLATAAAVLALTLPAGIAPLLMVGLITLLVAGEAAIDLTFAPPEPAGEPPVLPHELARRRGGA